MQSHSYEFANRLWVDLFVVRGSLRRTARNLALFSATPWLLGAVVAIFADRARVYLSTPAFYVGAIGIFLTTCGLAYASNHQYAIYERYLACFSLSTEERQAAVHDALARHSRLFLHLRAAVIIFVTCTVFVTLGFEYWSQVEAYSRALGTKLPRFEAFARYGWYDPQVARHGALIVIVFGFFIALPLGTAGSMILRLPLFLWRLSGSKPVLPPALVKIHFAPAASFYMRVSVLWLLGVFLFLYFFGLNKDWLSLGFVAVVFALAVVNFILPQIAYARVVSAAEDQFLELLGKHLAQSTPVTLAGRGLSSDFVQAINGVDSFMSLLKHEHWVYPIHHTYIVVGSFVASSVFTLERLGSLVKVL